MLRVLQARLQQYMNWELPDVPAGFRKGKGTRSYHLYPLDYRKSKRIPGKKKHLFLLHGLCQSLWLCESQWEILQEMELPNHFTCLLRNLYAGQEAIVRTGHGTTDWFQIGKGVRQSCILSPCLFNLYVSHNTKCQVGWSISWNQYFQEKYQ